MLGIFSLGSSENLALVLASHERKGGLIIPHGAAVGKLCIILGASLVQECVQRNYTYSSSLRTFSRVI